MVEVTVIAGEVFGVRAAIRTHTPICLQDWRVRPGARAEIEIEPGFNVAAYVFDGCVEFSNHRVPVERGQMAIFGAGDRLTVNAAINEGPGRFLLLGGQPINEQVARHGPFVMNTRHELITAFDDFQSGRMGIIQRT